MPVSRRRKPGLASNGDSDGDDAFLQARPTKTARKSVGLKSQGDPLVAPIELLWPRLPAQPGRLHAAAYHRPHMMDDAASMAGLLTWFEGVSSDRQMPWRQDWIDPSQGSKNSIDRLLRVRAYQVWISEIMLQQTRVETVKGYWTKWMAKWPTIESLAAAKADEVLSAWRGLGYYSRATRIHVAAQKVVEDHELRGMLPELPEDLKKHVPGVGRYTAGAISSIVFGHAVPILDGNVTRVLSRQMALHASPKSKETTNLLWKAAGMLVEQAALAGSTTKGGTKKGVPKRSRIAGQWNQALMELGSTVCTPKPNCQACPIRETCLAYLEGKDLALKATGQAGIEAQQSQQIVDIEDACSLCEPISSAEEEGKGDASPPITKAGVSCKKSAATAVEAASERRGLRQATLSFGPSKAELVAIPERPPASGNTASILLAATQLEKIEAHVKLFPMKAIKKQVRKEECIVCVLRRPSTSATTGVKGKKRFKADQSYEYLIEQRPSSGLLASMWQFPSLTTVVEDGDERSEMYPNEKAKDLPLRFAGAVLKMAEPGQDTRLSHTGSLGDVTHIFSHLQLLMRIHVVTLTDIGDDQNDAEGRKRGVTMVKEAAVGGRDSPAKNRNFGTAMLYTADSRWASEEEVEAESMGTGMRNCWALVVQAPGDA